jgi:hypothetical protein
MLGKGEEAWRAESTHFLQAPGAFPVSKLRRKFATASAVVGSARRGATVASSGQSRELDQGNSRKAEKASPNFRTHWAVETVSRHLAFALPETAGTMYKCKPPHRRPHPN